MISTLGLTCNVGWFEKLNVAEKFSCATLLQRIFLWTASGTEVLRFDSSACPNGFAQRFQRVHGSLNKADNLIQRYQGSHGILGIFRGPSGHCKAFGKAFGNPWFSAVRSGESFRLSRG